jgi:hypothetical protein
MEPDDLIIHEILPEVQGQPTLNNMLMTVDRIFAEEKEALEERWAELKPKVVERIKVDHYRYERELDTQREMKNKTR